MSGFSVFYWLTSRYTFLRLTLLPLFIRCFMTKCSSSSTSEFSLPIDALYQEFVTALKHNHIVVESDTGSGKSTRLPIWCAKGGKGSGKKRVLVIEPRRVACLALSDFVGSQALMDDGKPLIVGHGVRFDSTIKPETDIAFVTPGVALRWLSSTQGEEAGLDLFDLVMIDEFHERRWDTDLLLAMLKRKAKNNNSFRLVLTSATIDGERLTDYLAKGIAENTGAKRLTNKGRRFHVELKHLAKESHHLPDIRGLEHGVSQAVQLIFDNHNEAIAQGDILVFLPGKREISLCQQALHNLCQSRGIQCLALHGGIDAKQQKRVLETTEQQRLILATNVAETSLTIPGVTSVIDSGLERRTHQRNGRSVLSLSRISKASAEQRKGRAGRIADGLCIRLWGQHAPLEGLTPPELQREELVEPMLAAACGGVPLEQLAFIDSLPEKSVLNAKQKLIEMAAIDDEGLATSHGKRLFPLPIDTQFAHLISAMPDRQTRALMIDLASVLSLPQNLYMPPKSEWDNNSLQEWEPLGCDATCLLKLIREGVPDFLEVDSSLRKDGIQLANQIREALDFTPIGDIDRKTLSGTDWLALRHRWLLAVMRALPELAFIRRVKREQALGNGFSEVQIARDSRFGLIALDTQYIKPRAAVVFDQFSTAASGGKAPLNLAVCMAPIEIKDLVEAELGEERVLDAAEVKTELLITGQVKLARYFAEQVIDTQYQQASGDQVIASLISSIVAGKILPGVAKQLTDDLQAWDIWLALGMNKLVDCGFVANNPLEPYSYTVQEYLSLVLDKLGIENLEDVELIEEGDLAFDAIPHWLRSEFDQKFPRSIVLSELSMSVEYLANKKTLVLHHISGNRKAGPKRWELPSWQGWKIKYQKASKIVDVK